MSADFNKWVLPLATIVILVCWIIVTEVSQQPDHLAVVYFLIVSAIMLSVTVFVVWHYYKHSEIISFRWIFFTAVALRLISLFGLPLFEDDYYRYLWDGYQTVATNDPYTLAPIVFFDREDYPEIFDSILSLINYPEIATVYGPVTQWVFALGYLIQPATVWPLQLIAGLADLAVLVLLYKLGAGRSLLFYAWSPLLLKEFSLTAHPDIYAMLAMVLGIYLVRKNLVWLAGMVLALGVGAKVFAVLVLPYLIAQRWSVTYWSTLCGWFAATIALITLAYGNVTIWAPEGLQAMADSWLFNSGVYLLLLQVFSFQTIKLLLLGIFAGFVLLTCLPRLLTARRVALENQSLPQIASAWPESRFAFRGDWLFLIFLLALPVVNAWYVAWLLPFATLFPRWWSWALSYFCLLSYCTGTNLGYTGERSLELPVSIIAVEYLAVIGLALLALIISRHHLRYRAYTWL